jgi:hypothetical protein
VPSRLAGRQIHVGVEGACCIGVGIGIGTLCLHVQRRRRISAATKRRLGLLLPVLLHRQACRLAVQVLVVLAELLRAKRARFERRRAGRVRRRRQPIDVVRLVAAPMFVLAPFLALALVFVVLLVV